MLQTTRRVFLALYIFLRFSKTSTQDSGGAVSEKDERPKEKPKAELVNKLRDCFWAGDRQKR